MWLNRTCFDWQSECIAVWFRICPGYAPFRRSENIPARQREVAQQNGLRARQPCPTSCRCNHASEATLACRVSRRNLAKDPHGAPKAATVSAVSVLSVENHIVRLDAAASCNSGSSLQYALSLGHRSGSPRERTRPTVSVARVFVYTKGAVSEPSR